VIRLRHLSPVIPADARLMPMRGLASIKRPLRRIGLQSRDAR
jgi:hypothetical protein